MSEQNSPLRQFKFDEEDMRYDYKDQIYQAVQMVPPKNGFHVFNKCSFNDVKFENFFASVLFENCTFENVTFTGKLGFEAGDCKFKNCTFTGSDMDGVRLSGQNSFDGSKLDNLKGIFIVVSIYDPEQRRQAITGAPPASFSLDFKAAADKVLSDYTGTTAPNPNVEISKDMSQGAIDELRERKADETKDVVLILERLDELPDNWKKESSINDAGRYFAAQKNELKTLPFDAVQQKKVASILEKYSKIVQNDRASESDA